MKKILLLLFAAAVLAACSGNPRCSRDASFNEEAEDAVATDQPEGPYAEPAADSRSDEGSASRADGNSSVAEPRLTVIDFSASWCGPCRMFKPVFEQAARKWGAKCKFKSVDIDENPELAERYGISVVPTIIVLDASGAVVLSAEGYMDEADFNSFLSQASKSASRQ